MSSTGKKRSIDIVALILAVEIAPAIEIARPIITELSAKLIAPFAIIFPLKMALTPTSTAPPICQNTLYSLAELISVIFESPIELKAPEILIINNELGLFLPSKINSPVIDEADNIQ